jgi:hypothetical protein
VTLEVPQHLQHLLQKMLDPLRQQPQQPEQQQALLQPVEETRRKQLTRLRVEHKGQRNLLMPFHKNQTIT